MMQNCWLPSTESQSRGEQGHIVGLAPRLVIRAVQLPALAFGPCQTAIADKQGGCMTAFNVVRFKVKPGREQHFLGAHKKVQANWPGLKHANMIKTGDRDFCIIAEWTDLDALANSRPNMIATLDSFRDTLEDLGEGLGATDPVSGPVVLALK
jgi:hypothetical protein